MKKSAATLVLMLYLGSSTSAVGYGVETHRILTQEAVFASVLPERLGDLGLTSLAERIDDFTFEWTVGMVEMCWPGLRPVEQTILDIIASGAYCEDMTFGDGGLFRYLYHFYDPAHAGKGLGAFDSSLLWSVNTNRHAVQTYAYDNARSYLEQSVRATDETERRKARAKFLRTLGHLTHLIQDLGQPQHTREDPHGFGSGFESYVDEHIGGLSIDAYNNVQIDQWDKLWSTPNLAGLADFTNGEFISEGRNFRGTPQNILPNDYQPLPDGSLATISPPVDLTTLPCGTNIPGGGFVKFVSLPVADRYRNWTDTVRAATFSILASDLAARVPAFAGYGAFSMNDCNYEDAQQVLLPAAIGYSAGLIDYVLRGKMTISAPDTGFYAIVDHALFAPGQPNTPTDVTGGFRGFDKIKLKLKNETAPLTPPDAPAIIQDMSGGTLTAVLKFHRNQCYDDLLIAVPASQPEAVACRSGAEEIVVSNPLTVAEVPFSTVGEPNGPELAFQFPQQLPINAWDVVLQIVYRGRLGTEDDVVVVTTKDLSEPTFVTYFNATDYVVLNNQLYRPEEITQAQLSSEVYSACRVGSPGNYSLASNCYNNLGAFVFAAGSSNVTISATGSQAVAPRRWVRFSLLQDLDASNQPKLGWIAQDVTCYIFLANPLTILPQKAQDYPQIGFDYTAPVPLRGVNQWNKFGCFADIGITLSNPDSLDLTVLDDVSGAERAPTPITITDW